MIELEEALAAIEHEVSNGEAIGVVLSAPSGAELMFTLGGPDDGSTFDWFPADYEQRGAVGSMTSLGDRAAMERDDWSPAVTAFYFGHDTELPRWSIVPRNAAREAIRRFFVTGGERPDNLEWVLD